MKRLFALFIVVFAMTALFGCGAKEVTINMSKEQAVLFSFDDYNLEEGQDGYLSRTENEDGSLTYVLSSEQQKAVLDKIASSADEAMTKMVGSDATPNITDVTANKDYTEFVIKTTSESATFAEELAELALVISGNYYNIFSENADPTIKIQIINADSGEVLDEFDSSKDEAPQTTTTTATTTTTTTTVTTTTSPLSPLAKLFADESKVMRRFDVNKNTKHRLSNFIFSIPSYWKEVEEMESENSKFYIYNDNNSVDNILTILSYEGDFDTKQKFLSEKTNIAERALEAYSSLSNITYSEFSDIQVEDCVGFSFVATGNDNEKGIECIIGFEVIFDHVNRKIIEMNLLQNEESGVNLFEDYSEIASNVYIAPVLLTKRYRTTDWGGNAVLVLEIAFQNYTDQELSYSSSFSCRVFQNNVELDKALLVDGIDSSDRLKGVLPNGTYKVSIPFELQDLSDVTIVITDLFEKKLYVKGTVGVS